MPTLHWVGKEKVVNHHHDVPFRVLDKVSTFRASEGLPVNSTDNRIIHGDNLEALKSLLPEFEGRVKCIYIDPPYNTGNEGWVYNDAVNDPKMKRWLGQVVGKEGEDLSRHDKWLCMMYPRLKLLHRLLSPDGSLWVSLDDNESHYFKCVCDEIFGRENFIMDFIWRKRDGAPNDRTVGSVHEHVFVWAKSRRAGSSQTVAEEQFNLMPRTEKADAQYKVFAEPNGPDERGAFRKIDTTANGKGGRYVESLYFPIRNPYTQEDVYPRAGTCWRHNREEMERLQNERRLYWGVKGTATTPMRKLFAFEAKQGMTTPSIWEDVGLNQHASSELEQMFGKKAHFDTPKPTSLLERIVQIATFKDSIVLDSFAGSGTTGHAVIKINANDGGTRKFVMIESQDYAETTTAERIRTAIRGYGVPGKIVAGLGGGFDFYTVGEPMFLPDQNLNEAVGTEAIRGYVAYSEGIPPDQRTTPENPHTPYLLGLNRDTAWIFHYEPDRATSLDMDFLSSLRFGGETGATRPGTVVIYADRCLVSPDLMRRYGIVFKKIPRDITRF
ncbi:site-specific DNA-methyltransferase [Sphaerotilus sp.]|uniref:site-specific DNA-methyltransferase n=1 Tax=Sphaerotilus sp. TaxID=2093942 RepID=UPI002ACE3C66|nr:site-specific DNA-methyltransferase [Sphaerotilus sp.]MDZ7856731.1 site-specific DNA-methyltransferase [Sphaerotilus sp.]